MLHHPQRSHIQAEVERQQRQRTIRRLANAVAEALQLSLEGSAGALQYRLGQSISLRDHEALQRWVSDKLIEFDMPADNEAIEPLRQHLARVLSEVH